MSLHQQPMECIKIYDYYKLVASGKQEDMAAPHTQAQTVAVARQLPLHMPFSVISTMNCFLRNLKRGTDKTSAMKTLNIDLHLGVIRAQVVAA